MFNYEKKATRMKRNSDRHHERAKRALETAAHEMELASLFANAADECVRGTENKTDFGIKLFRENNRVLIESEVRRMLSTMVTGCHPVKIDWIRRTITIVDPVSGETRFELKD